MRKGEHIGKKALQNTFLNALSTTPRTLTDTPRGADMLPVLFAGLVPGQVWMYQLNIRLPSPLTLYPCGGEVHANAAVLASTTLAYAQRLPTATRSPCCLRPVGLGPTETQSR